jgi:hypothetical protein
VVAGSPSQAVSSPGAGSPAVLVVPEAQPVQTLLLTYSFSAQVMAVHPLPELNVSYPAAHVPAVHPASPFAVQVVQDATEAPPVHATARVGAELSD